jgi:7-cyano-7-deazaguanine synthase
MSGGIDSTTCFHLAMRDHPEVTGISIDYGQRHRKEIEFATAYCTSFNCQHHLLSIKNIIPRTMLTNATAEVPDISYAEIHGVSPTYVPFRNGLMLSAMASLVAGHLDALDEAVLYFGAHADDAAGWAYPDCTPEFVGAMANAIFVGTYYKARLLAPLQYLNKAEIIALGDRLDVNWSKTWSCYKGEDLHCGTCPTCRSRRQGFIAAKIKDPTDYQRDDEYAAS